MSRIDHQSVAAWIDEWGDEVASVDLGASRCRFVADVVAFGTFTDVMVGLDRLHDEQWSQVWPTIEGFRFLTDHMEVQVSRDRLMAVAIVGWDSVGIAADGLRFPRPGRATVVLERTAINATWMGIHTHFSLGRGAS